MQWVTFNRPEARNALTWTMFDGLVEVSEAVNRDREIKAMVLIGAGGRVVRVVALIGASRLSDLVMRARLMDPDEMMASGMVTAVTPDEASLVDRAQALAEEVAANAPLTMWATKVALRRLRERMAPEGADQDLILRCYLSRDFREGVESFLEKRKPIWTGE